MGLLPLSPGNASILNRFSSSLFTLFSSFVFQPRWHEYSTDNQLAIEGAFRRRQRVVLISAYCRFNDMGSGSKNKRWSLHLDRMLQVSPRSGSEKRLQRRVRVHPHQPYNLDIVQVTGARAHGGAGELRRQGHNPGKGRYMAQLRRLPAALRVCGKFDLARRGDDERSSVDA